MDSSLAEVLWLDATAQAELIATGQVSAAELVEAAIARCEEVNPTLNAIIHPSFDRARQAAEAVDEEAPFAGVPMVTKDLVCSEVGLPFHEGSRFLQSIGWTGPHDQELAVRFRDAGLVSIGRTNTPEFGMRPVCEPIAYGPTNNPWDLTRTPGGSSGGSAAAVAAGIVAVGHANDVGGSIRNPASNCGLFGLKPARSRSCMAPDFGDAMGGLAEEHVVSRSVRDSARMLDALFRPRPDDWYVAPLTAAASFAAAVEADPEPLRVGFLSEHPIGVAPDVSNAVIEMAGLLDSLGHHVEPMWPDALDEDLAPIAIPHYAAGTAWVVDHHWPRVTGQAIPDELLEPVTAGLADMGRSVSGGALLEARELAQAWTRRLVAWWLDAGWDLLLTPVLPDPPVRTGEADDVRLITFAAPFNVSGLPAASVPGRRTEDGLPIGVQFVAGPWREDVIFAAAAQVERARPWLQRPDL